MSTDLATQIRAYARYVDEDQQAITMAEIADRGAQPVTRLEPPVAPRRPRYGWAIAAAALVTAVLVGLVPVLLRSESNGVDPAGLSDPSGFFAPSTIPNDFVQVQIGMVQSGIVYVRDVDGPWLPSDGGFAVTDLSDRAEGDPPDSGLAADLHLDDLINRLPTARELDLGGRRALVYESRFAEGPVEEPHVSVLVHDGAGGLLEVTSVGMSVDDTIALASDIVPLSVADVREIEAALPWTHLVVITHDSFSYDIPVAVAGAEYRVMLGTDLFEPQLYRRVGVSDPAYGAPVESAMGYLLLRTGEVPGSGAFARTLEADPGVRAVFLAPPLLEAQARTLDEFATNGTVLDEEPYIVQAPLPDGPVDRSGSLGEIPIRPEPSANVVPPWLRAFEPEFRHPPAATPDRPIVVVGSVSDPGGGDPATLIAWTSVTGRTCSATVFGDRGDAGCNDTGRAGWFRIGSSGTAGSLAYFVPVDTAVVEIVTRDGTYLQQPVAGHGIVAFGGAIARPTEIVAFDAAGAELGRWEVTGS